ARDLTQAAAVLLGSLPTADRSTQVELADPLADPLREIVATLLYRHDANGHSLRQVQTLVANLTQRQVEEVFDSSLVGRSRHDELLREHRGGYALTFDVLVDLGSFRDLHRHRRCVQVQQPLTWQHAFERPEVTFSNGLGSAAALGALEGGLGETYVDALLNAEHASCVV